MLWGMGKLFFLIEEEIKTNSIRGRVRVLGGQRGGVGQGSETEAKSKSKCWEFPAVRGTQSCQNIPTACSAAMYCRAVKVSLQSIKIK